MTIELSHELEKIVNENVASGMYSSAVEYIREAILLASKRDQLKRQRLDEAIAIGIAQADRGELWELDLAQLNAELDAELGHQDT